MKSAINGRCFDRDQVGDYIILKKFLRTFQLSIATNFVPQKYWEERLREKYSLAGVGDIRMPLSYNKVLYRLRRNAFRKAIRRCITPDNISVLDVGAGFGFYIDLWKQFGATVTGSDITEKAVSELQKMYPDSSFVQWDAGTQTNLFDTSFDAISAFDVFFHIVDDDRYKQAIANVSSLLEPEGYFLYSDYFMHGESKRMEHIVLRGREDIKQTMESNGLREVTRIPVFYMMNSPLVTQKLFPRRSFRAMVALAGRGELCGALFGWSAYPLERLLVAMSKMGTGTELVVYRKSK